MAESGTVALECHRLYRGLQFRSASMERPVVPEVLIAIFCLAVYGLFYSVVMELLGAVLVCSSVILLAVINYLFKYMEEMENEDLT